MPNPTDCAKVMSLSVRELKKYSLPLTSKDEDFINSKNKRSRRLTDEEINQTYNLLEDFVLITEIDFPWNLLKPTDEEKIHC